MRYHLILMLLIGGHQAGHTDVITVEPGDTRESIYARYVEHVLRGASARGIPTSQFATLFFSLEPNEIAG